MKTPMQELFEKFGHLLPNVEDEYVEKEREIILQSFVAGDERHLHDTPNAESYYTKITFKNE